MSSTPTSSHDGVVDSSALENALEAIEQAVPSTPAQQQGDEQQAAPTQILPTTLPKAAYDTASWAARVSFGYATGWTRAFSAFPPLGPILSVRRVPQIASGCFGAHCTAVTEAISGRLACTVSASPSFASWIHPHHCLLFLEK